MHAAACVKISFIMTSICSVQNLFFDFNLKKNAGIIIAFVKEIAIDFLFGSFAFSNLK